MVIGALMGRGWGYRAGYGVVGVGMGYRGAYGALMGHSAPYRVGYRGGDGVIGVAMGL